MPAKAVLQIKELKKSFVSKAQTVPVLKNVSFEVKQGEFFVIFGPSGCGKSTLLHVILGLEKPDSGQVNLLDTNFYQTLDDDGRSEFRKQHVGMVYQQPYWIKSLSVLKNVAFPALLLGEAKQQALGKAQKMLKVVGMLDWQDYIPTELSSGQQQRVNLARALISNPDVLVVDEPTGNLDYKSGQKLMDLLAKFNQKDRTIIMVTHDLEFLSYAKRAARMQDGQLTDFYQGKKLEQLQKTLKGKRGVTYEKNS
ncbi:MAG: ABC transporter ATP-binding protein [Patescibacteria group bacterium]|nr:ABC transporter ATP-binding protein [Patescibacteria group bacterium]